MASLYLTLFIISIIIILLITLLSDLVESIFDFLWSIFLLEEIPLLNPVSLFAALAVFGSSGYLLTQFSTFNSFTVFLISIVLSIFTIISLFYLIIKPKTLSETSLSFSIKQLVGMQGIVTIPIPANGFGEVLIKLGGGNSNQIAASYDQVEIKQDEKVFVVDEKEGVLYVAVLKL